MCFFYSKAVSIIKSVHAGPYLKKIISRRKQYIFFGITTVREICEHSVGKLERFRRGKDGGRRRGEEERWGEGHGAGPHGGGRATPSYSTVQVSCSLFLLLLLEYTAVLVSDVAVETVVAV